MRTQKIEIEQYCRSNNITIDHWVEETVSGTKAYATRSLGRIILSMEKDDVLVYSELSRLGRSLFMIMEILSLCLNKGCKVFTIKDNYKLGDNIESKILAFAFGLSAEIERTLISQRTKEALLRLKSTGKILGRPKGSKGKNNKLQGRLSNFMNSSLSILSRRPAASWA